MRRFLIIGWVAGSLVFAALVSFLVDLAGRAPAPPPQAATRPAGTAPAQAQQSEIPTQAALPQWVGSLQNADPAAGEKIATGGIKTIPACSSCHGQNGEPLDGNRTPRLAGLSPFYIAKQLHDFADGSRVNQMMSGYAALLNEQQIADVAAYYASRITPFTPPGGTKQPAVLERGEQLVTIGDDALMVQSCTSCHGPRAQGGDPIVPYIAGQSSQYISAAFEDWLSGRRKNDADGVMAAILGKLQPRDRIAVAEFLETIPPPGVVQGENHQ